VPRIAVMGAGAWGTALAVVAADADAEVRLWARRPELAHAIATERTNPDHLPGVVLPPTVTAFADAAEALADADVVVLSVPTIGLASELGRWGAAVGPDATLVSVAKGLDVATRRFASEVVVDRLGTSAERVVALSGPNLAGEIAQRLPSASVAAGSDAARVEAVRAAFGAPYFRVYSSEDRVGVEVAGAVKNVVAVAVGIAHGMGLGDNAKAAVLTRGLAEMMRLGVALGASPITFSGLAGVGDLVATCASPRSRNRTLGERLGRGERAADIAASTRSVAEAVSSAPAIAALADGLGVDMPLTTAVVEALTDGVDPMRLALALTARPARGEHEGIVV
jgi:glycerol-3-phosphate dehydrogenase (NAD(P)+)